MGEGERERSKRREKRKTYNNEFLVCFLWEVGFKLRLYVVFLFFATNVEAECCAD